MKPPFRIRSLPRWGLPFWAALHLLGIAMPCAADIPGYPPDVRAYDPREVAMLPEYCKFTWEFRERVPGGNAPGEIKRWQSILGPTLEALHHYCWGLMKTNRALILARTRQDRKFYLADSIGEFDYVIQRASRDFVLQPEILTRKGENLLKLGRSAEGVSALRKAIELKPDYWPPYSVLSDFYRETGDAAKARQTLVEGLSLSPDARALKRRLAELDADRPPPATPHSSHTKR